MPSRPLLIRLAAIGGSAVLLAALAAVPATAAGPTAAARAAGHTLDRGRVVVATAPRADAARHHRTLKTPGIHPAKHSKIDAASFAIRDGGVRPLIASPAPTVAVSFPGVAEGDVFGLEPPDPWVAVSPSYVLQSTNGAVRITNRAGNVVQLIPTWSLFSLGPSEFDSDPRFLWDAAKSRWVGEVVSYTFDDFNTLTSAYLNVAVSESADPTGAWRIFSYFFTDQLGSPTLPDYPGLSSSGDKIALTANEFDSTISTALGSSYLVLRWSDVIAGVFPEPALWTVPATDVVLPRPAVNQSATNDVHLIGIDNDTGDYLYAKLSGATPGAPSWTPISGMQPYCAAEAPRQLPSPATITDAVDGRPTNAVYRSGTLAVASTCFLTDADYARVSLVTTSTAAATYDGLTGPGGTTDAYMGGIGFASGGVLFHTWTQSSPADVPAAFAAARSGGTWYDAGLTQAGGGTYAGTRWGDYVGVAQDPVGSGAVWTGVEVAASDGSWETHVQRLVSDVVAPVVSKGPTQALITGTQLGPYTIPVKLAWTASDAGSGVARTRLAVDRFGSGLIDSGWATGSTAVRENWWKDSSVTSSYAHQYGAQAVDWAGNASSVVLGSRLSPIVYQQTRTQFTYSSSWKTTTSSKLSQGSAKYSSTVGASASFRTSGLSFGFVSTRASTRGKVKVYVDGTYKGTVSLTSTTTTYRRLMYTITFASSGTHTIKLVVRSGRVDVDAFIVLK